MRDIIFKHIDRNYKIVEGEIINSTTDFVVPPYYFVKELTQILGIDDIKPVIEEWLTNNGIVITEEYWENNWVMEWANLVNQNQQKYTIGADVALNDESYTVTNIITEISGDTLNMNIDLVPQKTIEEIDINFIVGKWGDLTVNKKLDKIRYI